MTILEKEELINEIVDTTIKILGGQLNNDNCLSKEKLSGAINHSIHICLYDYILLNRAKLFDALEVTQHPAVVKEPFTGIRYKTLRTGLMTEKVVAFVDGPHGAEMYPLAERNIKDDFIFQLQLLGKSNRKDKNNET